MYYKSRGSADGVFPSVNRAAVVTDARFVEGISDPEANQVRLTVFNPEGIFFSDWLYQGQNPGNWDWMPFQKDQQARMATGTMNESHPPATCSSTVTGGVTP